MRGVGFAHPFASRILIRSGQHFWDTCRLRAWFLPSFMFGYVD